MDAVENADRNWKKHLHVCGERNRTGWRRKSKKRIEQKKLEETK